VNFVLGDICLDCVEQFDTDQDQEEKAEEIEDLVIVQPQAGLAEQPLYDKPDQLEHCEKDHECQEYAQDVIHNFFITVEVFEHFARPSFSISTARYMSLLKKCAETGGTVLGNR
jgi:hypothetical protein